MNYDENHSLGWNAIKGVDITEEEEDEEEQGRKPFFVWSEGANRQVRAQRSGEESSYTLHAVPRRWGPCPTITIISSQTGYLIYVIKLTKPSNLIKQTNQTN